MGKTTLPNMPLAICFNSNKRRYNYAYSQVKPLLSRTDSFAHRAAILSLISGNGFHLPQSFARSKSIRTKINTNQNHFDQKATLHLVTANKTNWRLSILLKAIKRQTLNNPGVNNQDTRIQGNEMSLLHGKPDKSSGHIGLPISYQNCTHHC